LIVRHGELLRAPKHLVSANAQKFRALKSRVVSYELSFYFQKAETGSRQWTLPFYMNVAGFPSRSFARSLRSLRLMPVPNSVNIKYFEALLTAKGAKYTQRERKGKSGRRKLCRVTELRAKTSSPSCSLPEEPPHA